MDRRKMIVPRRRTGRMRGFDYREPRAYFVTFCTHRRRCSLSRIVADGVRLQPLGRAVVAALDTLLIRHPWVRVPRFVVMPNHVHAMVVLEGGADGKAPMALGRVIALWKSSAASIAGDGLPGRVWQRGFHEHVVRDEDAYWALMTYIDENPRRWREDRLWTE